MSPRELDEDGTLELLMSSRCRSRRSRRRSRAWREACRARDSAPTGTSRATPTAAAPAVPAPERPGAPRSSSCARRDRPWPPRRTGGAAPCGPCRRPGATLRRLRRRPELCSAAGRALRAPGGSRPHAALRGFRRRDGDGRTSLRRRDPRRAAPHRPSARAEGDAYFFGWLVSVVLSIRRRTAAIADTNALSVSARRWTSFTSLS